MLANRALKLAVHYNMTLEPHQISAEEVLNPCQGTSPLCHGLQSQTEH